MLEPSKPIPSSKRSAVSSAAGIEKCCHSPGTSTNLKSTISTLFFFTKSNASLTAIAVFASLIVLLCRVLIVSLHLLEAFRAGAHVERDSNCVRPFFTGADTYNFFDVGYKDLSVADLPGPGIVSNHFNDLHRYIVRHENLDFHLRQKIYGILSAAIKLGMALLASEPFHLFYRHSLN